MKSYIFVNAILFFVCAAHKEDILVQIKDGALKGTNLTSRNNNTFFAFLGIPYAKPPVGNLRFKSPQPAESWEGLRDATKEGPICVQYGLETGNIEGDENCLFLNVFTPELSPDSLKPVMVWIHGGAFVLGSGNRNFAGPDSLIDADVLVVTFNYRLGVLGFLNLGLEEVPGNAGLKDQVLALKWVQENIQEFGGNPDKVTIVGENAGGTSVHLHILSPMSTGLFHCAISESGSGLDPWAFNTPNLRIAYELGLKLGIIMTDKNWLVRGLQGSLIQALLRASREFIDMGKTLEFYTPFSPTMDTRAPPGDVFLPDTPLNLINSNTFNKVPYITGSNSQEGLMFMEVIRKVINKTVEENVEKLRPEDFGIKKLGIREVVLYNALVKDIEDFYFNDTSNYNTRLQQYIDFTGDIYFYKGKYCTIEKQALYSTAPVYSYMFSYSGNNNIFKNLFEGTEFPVPNVTSMPESSELQVSKRLVRIWTNFAKSGNPTPEPEPLLENIIWSPLRKSSLSYLKIDTGLSMEYNPRKANMEFWKKIFQKYFLKPFC